MTLLLDTDFEFAELVQHKTDSEKQFIITGFVVHRINKDFVAIDYTIQCSCGDNLIYTFTPEEIEKIEETS